MLSLASKVKHLARVWVASTRASLVREMEFRGNFVAGLVRQMLWLGVFILMIEVMFSNAEQLAGWNRAEVLLILALSRVIEGLLATLFIRNLMQFPALVQEGKFDFHLTKPLPVQFYTAFRSANFDNAANVISGLVLFGYAAYVGNFGGVSWNWVWLFVLAFSGMVIYYSLLVMSASLVFVLERLEFLWGFNMLISEPLTVPFDIFPRAARFSLTYLVPLAFVVYVPAQAITGRMDMYTGLSSLVAAAVSLTLANLAWRAGLKRYTSASS